MKFGTPPLRCVRVRKYEALRKRITANTDLYTKYGINNGVDILIIERK